MKWFKFYGQDYISDPKMLSLSASERSCWITLLSYASVNDNGKITFLSEEQLMMQAGLDFQNEDWDRTRGVFEKLKKLGMIAFDNGEITVLNWGKRQEINLTSYERVKRYREKKRGDNANDNAKITPEQSRREEKRIKIATTSVADKIETYHKEIVGIIDAFKEINPLEYKTWYKNKTQRAAILRLLEAKGENVVLKVIALLPQTNITPFMPVITTPYKLAMKWSDLEAGLKKKKAGVISKGRGLA